MSARFIDITTPQIISGVAPLLKKYKKVRIFIDLHNVFKSFFVKEIIREIVYKSSSNRVIDSSMAQSIFLYISRWKKFFYENGVDDYLIFLVFDRGKSVYHTSIDPAYKACRSIDATIINERMTDIELNENLSGYVKDKHLYNLRKRISDISKNPEEYSILIDFKPIRDNNLEYAMRFLSRVNKVCVICLENMESDFVPYYYFTRSRESDCLYLIVSNDHDMMQTLLDEDIYQVYHNKEEVILSNKNVVSKLLYKEDIDDKKIKICESIDVKDIPLIFALAGDRQDDVHSLDGIGYITAAKILADKRQKDLLIGSTEEVYDRVSNGGFFFKCKPDGNIWDKIYNKISFEEVNKIVTNSFKLTSFELLCRWLEDNPNLFRYGIVKKLRESFDDKKAKKDLILTENDAIFVEKTLKNHLIDFSLNSNEIRTILL